jgi:predicted dehydrogenase
MTTNSSFGWAVLGPGRIAHRFAGAVAALPDAHLAIICSRDAARAEAFAGAWSTAGEQGSRPRATTDLDALLRDPQVHGLYIATPHAQHFEAAMCALQAGKPVLCEKPLVPNAEMARRLVEASRERGVFLMEAVWSRYLPIYDTVADWLRSGTIGALRAMQSSFCFPLDFDAAHRCFDPALAGGALLDIGIYNLTVTRWAVAQATGAAPELHGLQARALLGPTGVDHRLHATLELDGSVSSQFVCGLDGAAHNSFRIDGEHGHITLHDGFWQSTGATLVRAGSPPLEVSRPFLANGFEYEVAAAMEAIRAGLVEEARMPHAETIATLEWMDRIRSQVGVRYPFE